MGLSETGGRIALQCPFKCIIFKNNCDVLCIPSWRKCNTILFINAPQIACDAYSANKSVVAHCHLAIPLKMLNLCFCQKVYLNILYVLYTCTVYSRGHYNTTSKPLFIFLPYFHNNELIIKQYHTLALDNVDM